VILVGLDHIEDLTAEACSIQAGIFQGDIGPIAVDVAVPGVEKVEGGFYRARSRRGDLRGELSHSLGKESMRGRLGLGSGLR
jgi:hypothetical protein